MQTPIGHRTIAATHEQWKRQVFAAACGITLVVAAVAGIGVWGSNKHAKSTDLVSAPVRSGPPASIGASRLPQGFTFYLVGSQEQVSPVKAMLQVGSLAGARVDDLQTQNIVAVVVAPEDLARIQGAAAELDNAVIVDLRQSIGWNETSPGW